MRGKDNVIEERYMWLIKKERKIFHVDHIPVKNLYLEIIIYFLVSQRSA